MKCNWVVNEDNSSRYWTLAVMYSRRNQFVIPLTLTLCGTSYHESWLKSSKIVQIQRNSEHYTIKINKVRTFLNAPPNFLFFFLWAFTMWKSINIHKFDPLQRGFQSCWLIASLTESYLFIDNSKDIRNKGLRGFDFRSKITVNSCSNKVKFKKKKKNCFCRWHFWVSLARFKIESEINTSIGPLV